MGRNKLLKFARPEKIDELENAIQRQILDYLKIIGQRDFWRQGNHGIPGKRFNGRHGVHDILGFLWPKHFPIALFTTIEVKQPGCKMSDDQLNFADMIKRNGHFTFKACSIDDVKYCFKRLNQTTWDEWLINLHKK